MGMTLDELKALPIGTRVRFTDEWEIWPMCIVPKGTLGTLKQVSDDSAWVLTDDPEVTEALSGDWEGEVQLYFSGLSVPGEEDTFPVELAEFPTAEVR